MAKQVAGEGQPIGTGTDIRVRTRLHLIAGLVGAALAAVVTAEPVNPGKQAARLVEVAAQVRPHNSFTRGGVGRTGELSIGSLPDTGLGVG